MKTHIQVSDYVADFLASIGVRHVFMISGGGNMQIVDSIGRQKNLTYTCNHHEQASAMAAESHARVSGSLGVVILTTGPSGTNALTGVAGAWLDSTPMLVISGQVKTADMIQETGLRQFGVQELPVVDLAAPITKYARVVQNPKDIRRILEEAVHHAITPRFGPVWVDIPLDVQSARVNLSDLPPFKKSSPVNIGASSPRLTDDIQTILKKLKAAKRPVLYVGAGVRLAGALSELEQVIDHLGIPVQTAWNGADMVASDHPFFMGRPGSFGMRYSNFILQNCDFFLSVGARLSVPQIGYDFSAFAPHAYKAVVDVDSKELAKPSLATFDLKIQSDAKMFLKEILLAITDNAKLPIELTGGATEKDDVGAIFKSSDQGKHSVGAVSKPPSQEKHAAVGAIFKSPDQGAVQGRNLLALEILPWLSYCRMVKKRFPLVTHEQRTQKKYVNSYFFIETLSDLLDSEDTVITDMGTSFTCTAQVFAVKKGQRYFTSSGLASMGFGLPGAVGAALASKGRVICISGDGGLQMNIQELQTIIHHGQNIKLFVFNNQSYLTIRETQRNFFKSRFIASSIESGVSCPNIIKVGKAYGFSTFRAIDHKGLNEVVAKALQDPGPVICEILMDPSQQLTPKLTSSIDENGQFRSNPLHNMYPFLDKSELESLMIED